MTKEPLLIGPGAKNGKPLTFEGFKRLVFVDRSYKKTDFLGRDLKTVKVFRFLVLFGRTDTQWKYKFIMYGPNKEAVLKRAFNNIILSAAGMEFFAEFPGEEFDTEWFRKIPIAW